MKIAFLHISDMHITGRKCFDFNHIQKIASTFNTIGKVDEIIVFISGDIAYSGQADEYKASGKIIGSIIKEIKKILNFTNYINVFCVPGNHDVDHSVHGLSNYLLQKIFKDNAYTDNFANEMNKLKNYNNLAKFNRCEINGPSHYSLSFQGYTINVILLNSAVYSLKEEEDKGLHFISEDVLKSLDDVSDADFSIAMMHHSTDFLIDRQKEIVDEYIFTRCNAFYYGHEHHSVSKDVKYESEDSTFLELCGSLCNCGDWSNSSFYLNVLDTEVNKYIQKNFSWNNKSMIYECISTFEKPVVRKANRMFKLDLDFKKEIFNDDKNPISPKFTDYYVFPRIKVISYNDSSSREITTFDKFNEEFLAKKIITITGISSSGKTAFLKYCFLNYIHKYTILYCNAININRKNCNQIIKGIFQNNYGDDKSDFDKFSQVPKENKIMIVDDIDCLKKESFELFLDYIKNNFEYCIFSAKHFFDDIKCRIESYFNISDKETRYEITPFFADKREELVGNLTSIFFEDKLVAQRKSKLLTESIKKQKRFISLDPDFLIRYVTYYCKNLGEIQNSGINVFSKVFEANITNTLSQVTDRQCNVDKMFTILSKIAYFIHSTSTYPISGSQINAIIDQYNNEYGSRLNSVDFIERMEKSEILYSMENGYRFKSRNILAFFIAYEVLSVYGENQEKANDDILNIMKCSCFGINNDILMFISYMTNNVNILLLMIDKALKFTEDWEEFSFEEKPPKVLAYQVSHYMPMVSDGQIEQATELEIQEEKKVYQEEAIETVDIYNYSEEDTEDPFNQIVRSFALLMVISKCLPSFEHSLKIELKKRLIETIYQIPNKIFNKWASETGIMLDGLIKFIYERNMYYYHKKLTGEQIMAGINYTSLTFLLDLYNIAVYGSAKENTYQLLTEQFEYGKHATYSLQHVLMTEECGTTQDLINELLDLSERFSNKVLEINCLRMIANHSIINKKDLSLQQRSLIESKVFTTRDNTKSNRMLIPINNSTKESKIIIDRSQNQKKK